MAGQYDVEAALTLRDEGFGSGFRGAERTVDNFTSSTERSGDRVARAWGGMSKGVKTLDGKINSAFMSIGKVAAVGFAAISAAAVGFGVMSIKSAADAQALNAQFSTVFGDMEKDASKNLNEIAKQTNILPNRLKGSFAQITSFAKTAGMDTASALDLSSRATLAAADSAAFYDKSIGDVTESIQSYLKGNFENDAALGISSTETTRNAAANKLYGKSFIDLAEDQKQLTLLAMIEEGNQLSGALGQAAREGKGMENVMGNLKQSVIDLAAKVGAPFLDPLMNAFDKFSGILPQIGKQMDAFFASAEGQTVIAAFADAVGKLADKFVAFIQGVDIGEIAKKMVQFAQGLASVDWSGIIDKISQMVAKFIEFAPNIDNVIKGVLGFVIAVKSMSVIITVVNIISTLVGWFTALVGFITPVIAAFTGAGGAATGFTAVIAALGGPITLIIAAVVAFGAALVALWTQSETFRDIVTGVWQSVKDFISKAIAEVSAFVTSTFQGLLIWWRNNQEDIMKAVDTAWNKIMSVIKFILSVIVPIIRGAWETIKGVTSAVWETVKGVIEGTMRVIQGIIKAVTSAINGDWRGVWEGIGQFMSGIVQIIKRVVKGGFKSMVSVIEGILSAIAGIFTGSFDKALDVVTGFGDKFKKAGGALIDMVASGITGAIKAVTGAIGKVMGAVRDFLPFSPAKTGPLNDLDKLNFGGTISTGIYDGERDVRNAMNSILSTPDLAFTGSASSLVNRTDETTKEGAIYQFNLDMDIDGKEFTRRTIRYTEEELNALQLQNNRNLGFRK